VPKLADVAEINPRLDRSESHDLSEVISFVPMANVSDVLGAITSEEHRELGDVIKGFTTFKDRDVLVAKITPCFENGKIAHARIDKRLGFGSTEFHVVRPATEKLDDRYLYHFLRQPVVREDGKLRMTGSGGQKRVPKTFIEELEIPLPPLPEQRRIAAILDKADELRAKRREAIAKLDQLLQSVFLELFGDPVTNPKGWPMLPFGTVTDSRLGKMLDKRTSQGEHMKPYLANLNVQWGRFELHSLRSMHFSLKDQQEFSLRSGDLLMCEGGQPGRCAIWQEQLTDCYYQKALHRIRCHQEKCVPEYIQWLFWFLSQANAFSSAVTTATIAHLPGIKLKKMLIPLPPIDEQRSFASLIKVIEKNAALHRAAEEKLNHMFSSLQNTMFEAR